MKINKFIIFIIIINFLHKINIYINKSMIFLSWDNKHDIFENNVKKNIEVHLVLTHLRPIFTSI